MPKLRSRQFGQVSLLVGDMRQRLIELEDESIDAIVTDPPYGLGFMGKRWDSSSIELQRETWAAMFRVAKPGAHLVAFGGTRTFHRIWCAVEDAGWEIRDTIMWLYGQGFPKSSNQHGAWEGWGTALKPAFEPILLARKPLAGTVAANLERHGVGALNIDESRIATEGRPLRVGDYKATADNVYEGRQDGSLMGGSKAAGDTTLGRWPANVLHDGSDDVVAAFPQSAGQQGDVRGTEPSRTGKNVYSKYGRIPTAARGDSGSAARFFWCPKTSRKDRNDGNLIENRHPTVKPTELMRYLIKLVTPSGGLVLDPFMGSGSTGKAAVIDGFRFIGIEVNPEYVEIAYLRIKKARAKPRLIKRGNF